MQQTTFGKKVLFDFRQENKSNQALHVRVLNICTGQQEP